MTLDKDGYPTEDTLKKIEKWDVLKDGIENLINFIKDDWQFADVGYFEFFKIKKGREFRLKLSCAGWSGNEDIINALQKSMFWFIFWYMSIRGGHYYFTGKLNLNSKRKLTIEHKKKISKALKGKIPIWKGKHLSKEHKRKLAIAHEGQTYSIPPSWKGKHHSKKSKIKISNSLIGHPVSKETKQKIIIARAKQKITNKTKKILSKKWLKSKNPRWKGGTTPLIMKIRNSKKYASWRHAIMERDNFTCQLCKNKGGKLNVHHKIEFSKILNKYNITSFKKAIDCKQLFDLNNGKTFCKVCHMSKYHKNKFEPFQVIE